MPIKAKLSTFDATMIVVSLVIGIGIFRTPAIVASNTQTTFLFFAVWILGGLISFIGALTFAEIGSRFTKPGAFYKVVAECYHPSVAFMLNWSNVIIVNGAGAAAVAMIGAEYMTPILFPPHQQTQLATQLTAVGLALLLLVINFLGIKTGARTQNVLTILKIAMMLMLTYAAVSYAGNPAPLAPETLASRPWWIALGLGFIPVFYAYGGYQNTINFGADIKGATRNIPRAIFFGILIIISLYLVINFAYHSVLGVEGIAATKLVAAEVARICFGQSASTLVSVAIFLSAMGFLNVTLMQIPRAYYAMAEEGALPPIFGRVNEKTQTQEFALLFLGATILISVFFLGTFEKILNYVMFFDTLNNATVASTLFLLCHRAKSQADYVGYNMPLYPVLPGFFVLFLLSITVNVAITQPTSILMGIIILALGYPIFHVMRRVTQRRNAESEALSN